MSYRSRSGGPVRRSLLREVEEQPVRLPPVNKALMQERFKKTLIGRLFCKEYMSIAGIIAILPKPHIWNIEGRARGFNLGNDRFQFDFDSEDDLVRVLSKRLYHYNSWSFALERWEPNTKGDFPNNITFWIQTKCLPPEYRNDEALRSVKLQVIVDVSKPLMFDKKAVSEEGEEVLVTFKYEKLHRYCFTCKMISHEERSCPLLTEEERFQKRIERAKAARLAEEEEANFGHTKPAPSPFTKAGPSEGYSKGQSRWDSYEPSKRSSSSLRVSPSREPKSSELVHHRHHRNPNCDGFEVYRDRSQRPVWSRLSDKKEHSEVKFRDSSYPRHRENFKNYSEDQKRRR